MLGNRQRPGFHFAPERNWVNDPNGLVYWRDRYHLFFQYNPNGTAPGQNVAWGHAWSRDLIHWQELPLALTPGPDDFDRDGCWSGCAVVHEDQVHLLYTGVNGTVQRPCLAKAADPVGLTAFWKYPGNPVIREEPLPGLVGFRDHTVWSVGSYHHQLIGSGSRDLGGCVLEYRSKDLVSWEYLGVLVSAKDQGAPGTMWECPDLFQLGAWWVLIVSVHVEHPRNVMWFVGTFTDGQFQTDQSGLLDCGTAFYAPQSFLAPDGRRVLFGWLREPSSAVAGASRVGLMSAPRVLALDGDGRLRSSVVAELKQIRGPAWSAVATGEDRGQRLLRAPSPNDAVEVQIELAGDELEAVVIDLSAATGQTAVSVSIDADGIAVATQRYEPRGGGISPTTITLLYDAGCCEVFVDGIARSEMTYDRPLVASVKVQLLGYVGAPYGVRAWTLERVW